MAPLLGSPGDHRAVRIRLDLDRTELRDPLDRSHALLRTGRSGQLCDLYGYDRLHDRGVRTLCRFCYRRERVRKGFTVWYRRDVRNTP